MEAPQTATLSTPASPTPGASRLAADSVEDLLALSQVDLYRLFRQSSAGDIPTGRGRGTPIFFPGTAVTGLAAKVFGTVVWRGKAFSPAGDELKNMISILSIPAIRARVYREGSWFDDEECIVLDYSETSRICGWIRDEIRQVRPGLYVGLVYGVGRFFGGRRLLDITFGLSFPAASSAG